MAAESSNHLIKYCSSTTAEQILTSHQLRWSSPEVFGDPFELSSKINVGFTNESLLESTVKLASSMLFSSEHPKGDSPLLNAIKRWREEKRFDSAEEAHDVLRELLSKMVSYRTEQLNDSMGKWQIFVRNIRVCCFCSKPDNILAWEQYADKHKGIAIRFMASPDCSINNPQAIQYQTEPPYLTNIKEQLGCILHNKKDAITSRFTQQFLKKGPHQKQEGEWRCIQTSKKNIPVSDMNPDNWVDHIDFEKNQVIGVYFGINTPDELKKSIAVIVKDNYKKATLYQAVPSKAGYAIEFEKLSKL